jgi:hypothetical protein
MLWSGVAHTSFMNEVIVFLERDAQARDIR